MIEGVVVTKLKTITDDRGSVYRGLRRSESTFRDFGEAYFSSINKNTVKGWKLHRQMTLNIVVPVGSVRFALVRDPGSERCVFWEVELSLANYARLTVPPNIWMAFQGREESNLLLNIADIEHDPTEALTRDIVHPEMQMVNWLQ